MIQTVSVSFLAALVSAFVPALPIEPYLVGAVLTTGQSPVLLGVVAGAGQTLGKVLMLLGLRGTLHSAALRRWLARHDRPVPVPAGPGATEPGTAEPAAPVAQGRWRRWRAAGRTAVAGWTRTLTEVLDRPLIAAPVVLISATFGVPPLLLVVFCIGATRMPVGVFAGSCFVGRAARFVAIGLLPQLVHLS